MVQLEIFSPDGKSETVVLEKFPVNIGRSRMNDIVLTHRTVSRKHAVIVKKDGTYLIRDVGSQNGTFLRKRKIDEATLQNEDVIYIGAYTLKFVIREEIIDLEKTLGVAEGGERIKLKTLYSLEIPDRFHGVISPELSDNDKAISELDLSMSQEDTSLLAFPDEFLVPKEEFPTLYDLQRRAMEDEDFEDTLRNIGKYLLSRTDGDRVIIFLDRRTGTLDMSMTVTRPGVDLEKKKLNRFPSLLKECLRDGKAILAGGIDEEASSEADPQEKKEFLSYCAIFAPLKYDEKTIGAVQIETYEGKEKLDKDQLVFVCRIIRELAQIILWKLSQIEKSETKLLKLELSRTYPLNMVEVLFKKGEKFKQEFFSAKEQVASVITCKITNLPEIHKQVSPVETQKLLQHFIGTVRNSIINYEGSLVSMTNEQVIGVFGLPVKQLDAGVRAVLSALHALGKIEKNRVFKNLERRPVIGFGIQTGMVTGGDISLNGFHMLVALGSAVNVSSELAGLVEGKSQILIAPEVFFDVRFYFDIKEIGIREIETPSESLMVYEVLSLRESVSEESILYLASENADSEITSEEFLKFPDV